MPDPEIGDVLHERFGQVHLGPALLDVAAVEIVDEGPVEDGRHGRDRLELVADRLDVVGR